MCQNKRDISRACTGGGERRGAEYGWWWVGDGNGGSDTAVVKIDLKGNIDFGNVEGVG